MKALLARNPAAHVHLSDSIRIVTLVIELQRTGATEQLVILAQRAASQVSFGISAALYLLIALLEAGAYEQADASKGRRRGAGPCPVGP